MDDEDYDGSGRGYNEYRGSGGGAGGGKRQRYRYDDDDYPEGSGGYYPYSPDKGTRVTRKYRILRNVSIPFDVTSHVRTGLTQRHT